MRSRVPCSYNLHTNQVLINKCHPMLLQIPQKLQSVPMTCLCAAAEHRRRQDSVFAALGHGPRSPGQQRGALAGLPRHADQQGAGARGAPQPRDAAAAHAGGMLAQGEARGFLSQVGQPPAPCVWRSDPGKPERAGGGLEDMDAATGRMHEGGGNHIEDAPEALPATMREPDQAPERGPAPSPGTSREQPDPELPGRPESAAVAHADSNPLVDPDQAPQERPAPGGAPAAWDPGQVSGQGPVRVSYRYGGLRRAAAVRVRLFLRSDDPAAREARTCTFAPRSPLYSSAYGLRSCKSLALARPDALVALQQGASVRCLGQTRIVRERSPTYARQMLFVAAHSTTAGLSASYAASAVASARDA